MNILPNQTSPLRLLAVLAFAAGSVCAADNDIRLVPQLAVGTSGIEPGLALEWRGPGPGPPVIVRPEILLSEDERLGGGGAVLYDFSASMTLPLRQAFAVGPRVVYHNSDDHGWEFDAMATWGFDLGIDRPWRHSIGLLGALGVVEDRKHDDSDIGATAGIFYAFRP